MISRTNKNIETWFWFVIPALGALLAIWKFWIPGITSEADILIGIYRIFELREGLAQGALFPRLGPNLNFGYGAPIFQFYSPLASYLALPFYLLGAGLIHAGKLVFTIALFLGAIGTYVYAYELFKTRSAALTASFLYTFAPYLLVVIYERGAGAELLALGLLPWLFWSFSQVLEKNQLQWMWGSGILVALLMLAHNITALFVMPILGLYVLVYYLFVLAWRNAGIRPLILAALAFALGISLSAFYWAPAMLENRYTHIESIMLSGQSDVTANLAASWGELLQVRPFFDYWGEERFRLAWWQALLAPVGLGALFLGAPRQRNIGLFFALLFCGALFVQLEMSAPIWDAAPILRFIQFAWRLLGIASFCVAMLGGGLIYVLQKRAGPKWAWTTGCLLVVAAIVFSTSHLNLSRSSLWADLSDDDLSLSDLFRRGRRDFSIFVDYTPRDLRIGSGNLSNPNAFAHIEFPPVAGAPQVQVDYFSPYRIRFRVNNHTSFILRAHRIYFPGWQVRVNGNATDVFPSGPAGILTTRIPAGEHEVEIWFGPTPLRQIANVWSVLALGLLLGVYLVTSRSRMAFIRRAGLVGILFALLVGYFLTFPGRSAQPDPLQANFGEQLDLLGYRLPRTQFQPGDELQLQLYWFLREQAPNLKVFLHLVSPADEARVAQLDSEPVMGYSPTSHWMPGELIDDRYILPLDEDIPPGEYLLLMGVYHPDPLANLVINSSSVEVLPGDRLVVGRIQIGE